MSSSYQNQETQLVITIAEPSGLQIAHKYGARTTLGVWTQLIAQAQDRLILAAPFMQPGEGLNQDPLAGALLGALKRGVIVDLASTKQSLDTLDRDLLRQQAKRFIRFYQPMANYENETILGMHAKFCIVDGKEAYIGSANLTKPGLQQHFEMGVLVKSTIATQIEALWRYLVEHQFFVELRA